MTDPVPWTFAAGGAYSEELAWLTDMLQAPATGVTQHRRLRDNPRVAISFETLARADDRRWLESNLRLSGGGLWDAPVDIDGRVLGAAASGGATVLAVAGAGGMRLPVGSRVLLVGDAPRVFEVAEVSATAADTITLAAGLVNDWPVATRIVPLRASRLLPFPVFGRFTADATSLVRVQFQLTEALDAPVDFAGAAYRGHPVFDFVPVWLSDPTWSPERLLATVDNELATPAVFDQAEVAFDRYAGQYVLTRLEDIASFRSALWYMGGRCAPMWVPSWAHDVRIVATVANGATAIDIEGPLLSTAPLPANRRDVRIELHDGTVLHRRITAAVDLGGGVERLTLDAAIPSGFAPGAVAMACFMQLCTQGADVNLLRYFDWQTLLCELTWKALAHDV